MGQTSISMFNQIQIYITSFMNRYAEVNRERRDVVKNPLKFFFSDNFMQNHKKIFARKKDNVNFTQSTNLVNLKKKNMDMTLSGLNPTHFQGLVDGKQTGLYILVNKNGCELTLTNYGARIVNGSR